MTEHTDTLNDLDELRHKLLLMASYVKRMISDAVHAFIEQDCDLAQHTIETDSKVNKIEIDTDELCLHILARGLLAPSDLRFVTLSLKMVTDLERIGDLAVDVCERVLRLQGTDKTPEYDDIAQMGNIATTMVADAIDAFLNKSHKKAQLVIQKDQDIDQIYYNLGRNLMKNMVNNPSLIYRGIHTQSVAKFLERIGDHATNLAEQVIFMVKGKDIRHKGKLG